jgi:lipoprotein-anchoring transpeptidase ErfK/SrfK
MSLSRRGFLASALALGLAPEARAAEPFPVKMNLWKELPRKYRRQIAEYETQEPQGTIVIDPTQRLLYLVLGQGRAIRYGVALGRGAHAWTGEVIVKKMAAWPVWVPATYHIKTYPQHAKWLKGGMPGGPGNPLGARALYLFKGEVDTVNRIHGATPLADIGQKKTAGCIGMLDCDVIDLYARVKLGTRVVMLKKRGLFG